MALTDKDILITPNDGSSTADPKTEFTGANSSASDTITLETQFDGSITTLSYEGSAGQLFSISNDLSGTLFVVNDSSGIPSLEIDNSGEIRLSEFDGNVIVGNTSSTPLSSLFEGRLIVKGSGDQDPIMSVTDSTSTGSAAGVFHQSSTSPSFPAFVVNSAANSSSTSLISAYTNVNNTTGVSGTEVFKVTGQGNLTITGQLTSSTVNTGQGATEVHLMNQNVRTTDSPTFDELTVTDFVKASGNNIKFSAGGTHVLNIDLNRKIYPQTDNSTDIGFSSSASRFRDAYFTGTGNFGTINTGQGATEVHLMNQNLRTTDSPTFATLNVTGDLNITGDINTVSTTDLDILDKTITLGKGGSASTNDGAGIIVEAAGASLKWDNPDNYWKFNRKLAFDDTPTTTNQALGIIWSGFDKEGTSDSTDNAKIIHTTNTGGIAGSVLLIESQNDANDGIAFVTNGSSNLMHNSNKIWTAGNDGSGSGLDADTLDGKPGSDLFNFGYAYSSNNITRAVGSGAQWYKVASFSGGVKHITMKVHSSGDNTNGADSFFIAAGSYGMKANIVRMPSSKYNGTKLEEVRTKYVSGATYEIWVKVASITTSVGYLQVFMNDSGVTSSLSAGTEPTVGTADATLPVSASDRINYSLQATSKIEAMDGFVVNGNTVFHTGNDGSGSGLDADTVDGINSGSFMRSDTADSFTALPTFANGATGTLAARTGFSDFLGYNASYGSYIGGGVSNAGSKYLYAGGFMNDGGTVGTLWRSTNDGSGSGLDADTLDGLQPNSGNVASTIVSRNSSGDFTARYIFATHFNQSSSNSENPTIGAFWTNSTADTYNRKSTPAHVISQLGLFTSSNDGSGSGLDADTVDGFHVDANNGGLVKSYQDQGSGTFHTTISGKRSSMGMAYVTDGPAGSGSTWYRFIQPSYRDTGTNVWQTQLAFWGTGGDFSLRQRQGGSLGSTGWGSWTRVWTAGTDGSGSGLDADLLDGQHGSYYAPATGGNYTPLDHFRHTGHGNYTSTTTSALLTEALGDDAFDSKLTAHKTSWSYAGNGDLTDAGRLTELAGTSWLWWTDNSTDNVQGNITGLCIAPTTGGSAGKMFVYNNQGSGYAPGWREIWTSTSDGSGSGLDADLLDGQHGSYYLNYNNFTNTPTIPTNNNQLTNGAGYITSSGTASQSNMVTGSAFATTSSPSSVLEYQQASSITDTKLAPTGDWYNTIRMGHGNPYSYYSNTLAMQMTGSGAGKIRTQLISNNSAQGWRTIWDSSTDGSGSGLDADQLDGQHGSYYLDYNNFTNKPTIPTNNNQLTNGAGYTTYSSNQATNTNSSVTFNQVTTTNNGNGTNVKIGDDAWLGDTNAANTIQITGVQNSTQGYLVFGSSDNTQLGRSGTGALTYGGNTIWHAGTDGSGSGLDADLFDGTQKSDLDHAEGFKTWSGITANAAQARRFHIARLYGTPAHWDGNWQNIEFHVTAESYESGTLKFRMQGDYGGAGSQANMIKLYLTEVHGPMVGRFRFILGSPVDAGWDHSGQDTYYVDLFAEAAYYSQWKINAKTYGHPYQTSNPTSGGATTVFYSSPTVSNVSDFNISHNDTYIRGSKIWNALNDGSGSGLDADTLDGVQASQFLRSDTSDTMTAGTLSFHQSNVTAPTSSNATTGARLNLYPNGSGRDYTIGIESNNMWFNSDGGFKFYRDGALRFQSHQDGYFQINSHSNSWDGGLRMISQDGTDTFQIHPDNNGYMYVDKNWYFTGAVSIGSIGQYAWHSGNDGSGSGLDADTLDGLQASKFLSETGNNTGDFRFNPGGSSTSVYLGHEITTNVGSAYIRCVKQTGYGASGVIRFYLSPTNTTNTDVSSTYNKFTFESDGDFHADGDVIAFSTATGSDRKLKENIRDLEGSLDKTLKLRGVKYDWKDENKANDQLGFIAQEVEEVLPEVVKEVETLTKEGETHLTVNYPAVVPVLVEAIKEQQSIINRLEERLSDLENKLK